MSQEKYETKSTRTLRIHIPGGPLDNDDALKEVLSWDRDGDGTIDLHEIREASLAVRAEREKARRWKRTFLALAATAAAACAVLFGITMATNELSKETKTSGGGLVSAGGSTVTVEEARRVSPTLFEIPRLSAAELSVLSKVILPLSNGVDEFTAPVTTFARTAGTAESEPTTTFYLGGGATLEVSEDSARLVLGGQGSTFLYQKGPLDPSTGVPDIIIVNAPAATDADAGDGNRRRVGSAWSFAGKRRRVVHTDHVTGHRKLIRLGVDTVPDHPHYAELHTEEHRSKRGWALTLRQRRKIQAMQLPPNIDFPNIDKDYFASRTGSSRASTTEEPVAAPSWVYPPAIPGSPTFTPAQCIDISGAEVCLTIVDSVATAMESCRAEHGTEADEGLALNVIFTTGVNFPLTECARRRLHAFCPATCAAATSRIAGRSSNREEKAAICAAAHCAETDEVRYSIPDTVGGITVGHRAPFQVRTGYKIVTRKKKYGKTYKKKVSYPLPYEVCPGYDFDVSCPGHSLDADGDPVWTAAACDGPEDNIPLADMCSPAQVYRNGTWGLEVIDEAPEFVLINPSPTPKPTLVPFPPLPPATPDEPLGPPEPNCPVYQPCVFEEEPGPLVGGSRFLDRLETADTLLGSSFSVELLTTNMTVFSYAHCASHCPEVAPGTAGAHYNVTCIDGCVEACDVVEECLEGCTTVRCAKDCKLMSCLKACPTCDCDEYLQRDPGFDLRRSTVVEGTNSTTTVENGVTTTTVTRVEKCPKSLRDLKTAKDLEELIKDEF